MTAGALDAVVVAIIPSPGERCHRFFGSVAPSPDRQSDDKRGRAPFQADDNGGYRHRLEAEPRGQSAAADTSKDRPFTQHHAHVDEIDHAVAIAIL
jgi:hypothetical protein